MSVEITFSWRSVLGAVFVASFAMFHSSVPAIHGLGDVLVALVLLAQLIAAVSGAVKAKAAWPFIGNVVWAAIILWCLQL